MNLVTYLMSATVSALFMRRPDAVIVQTDPPLLSCLGLLLRRRFRCPLVIYLQDVYPDIAIILGKLSEGPLARILRRLLYATYRGADQVIVLSEDMRRRMLDIGVKSDRLHVVANWADTSVIYPIKVNNPLRTGQFCVNTFVVMYSGNLGLTQRLEEVLDAAERLRHNTRIKFLFVGEGADCGRLRRMAKRKSLCNVTFWRCQPKSKLAASLSLADVQLVPLVPELTGCLMPSKLYGILASGTPAIAVAPAECELARIVDVEGVGVLSPPGNPRELARQIELLSLRPDLVRKMGIRARDLCLRSCDRPLATTRFGDTIDRLLRQKPDRPGTETTDSQQPEEDSLAA